MAASARGAWKANFDVLIGLTGGIASGKSTARTVLEGLGAVVFDADKLGHRAYLPGTECFKRMVSHFGEKIVGEDGAVNRRVLGGIVFSDPREMEQLNALVWPAIAELAEQELAAATRPADAPRPRVAVLEAAVMVEAGWDAALPVTELWVTQVPRDVAVARIVERNGLSEEEAGKRVDAQLSNAARAEKATLVVDTTGTKEETRSTLEAAWRAMLARHSAGAE